MALPITQQKLAERINILHDQVIGITTRIYNIKKACGDSKSKPAFLSDRALEPALKYIVKRFPSADIRGGGAAMHHVQQISSEVLKSLQLYYFTFVDLLDLRDHVNELLTTIDACGVQFDITLNTDITYYYLDLIASYISLMILLSRVEDRKAVLGLYNAAYEIQQQGTEPSFPRMGQMIVDYDQPLKRLAEEFVPHQKVVYGALASLATVYPTRMVDATEWHKHHFLSITFKPNEMVFVAQIETMACQYLSLDTLDRWIILGLLVNHGILSSQAVYSLWQTALQNSLVLPLFRDEVVLIHGYAQGFFDSIKSSSKRLAEVKEAFSVAERSCGAKHRERRKFLRSALRELVLLFGDQPGLIAPKVLFVWMSLAFARDEISWLFRHVEHWPLSGNKSKLPEDLTDRQLPELLSYLEDLRALVERYSQVIQRYYLQYLSGYDAPALNELIQNLPSCPEEESVILTALCNQISSVSLNGSENEIPDFQGLRMDWFRLQAYMSCNRSPVKLTEHIKLGYHLNTMIFHTKMIDFLDQMLVQTSDMSFLCFYIERLQQTFHTSLELPSQARFLMAFPLACSHFGNSIHTLCPEERQHIKDRALSLCNDFLEAIATQVKNVLTDLATEYCKMSDRLAPKVCAMLLAESMELEQKAEKAKAKRPDKGSGLPPVRQSIAFPGEESRRITREDITTLDKLHMALTELCFAANSVPSIVVWEHTFAPLEYLTQYLENRFNKTLKKLVMDGQKPELIAKPSELLSSVRAFMDALQGLELYANLDVSRIFNDVLLQQTQPIDSGGEDTITMMYTKWYLEILLKKVSTCHIIFSLQEMTFIPRPNLDPSGPDSLRFNPQEYTAFPELRSLCELIGPYGAKFMCERLDWHVGSQIKEVKKLVLASKDILRSVRQNFDNPETMRRLEAQLFATTKSAPDPAHSLLQRMTIIGEILVFRDLLQGALADVVEERVPFLCSTVSNFRNSGAFPPAGLDTIGAYEMCAAMGQKCSVDACLVNALKAQATVENAEKTEEEYLCSCLLMVYIAVALPKLSEHPHAAYNASGGYHYNNMHCLPKAINEVASALFTLHGRGDIPERMKEFLALVSGSLLRLGKDNSLDRHQRHDFESVYVLLDKLVAGSPWLSMDLLESCFPYVLLRSAYQYTYKQLA